jgi:hypothetical protein
MKAAVELDTRARRGRSCGRDSRSCARDGVARCCGRGRWRICNGGSSELYEALGVGDTSLQTTCRDVSPSLGWPRRQAAATGPIPNQRANRTSHVVPLLWPWCRAENEVPTLDEYLGLRNLARSPHEGDVSLCRRGESRRGIAALRVPHQGVLRSALEAVPCLDEDQDDVRWEGAVKRSGFRVLLFLR